MKIIIKLGIHQDYKSFTSIKPAEVKDGTCAEIKITDEKGHGVNIRLPIDQYSLKELGEMLTAMIDRGIKDIDRQKIEGCAIRCPSCGSQPDKNGDFSRCTCI